MYRPLTSHIKERIFALIKNRRNKERLYVALYRGRDPGPNHVFEGVALNEDSIQPAEDPDERK